MVSLKTLEKCGCTQARLQAIFTSKPGDKDFEIRKHLCKTARDRINSGIERRLRHSERIIAVDIAWDSRIIHPTSVPIFQYAMGLMDSVETTKAITSAKIDHAAIKMDGARIKDIKKLPLHETEMNIVKSYVTRRTAAQVARYNKLYPYFKFEPRGTSSSDKLKGDATSMRIEQMTDQFGYKHFMTQRSRDLLLYPNSLTFPVCAWTHKESARWDEKSERLVTFTEKEGVDLIAPHYTSIFFDDSKPLPQINTDNGPDFVGFWQAVPYRSVRQHPDYFNVGKVCWGDGLFGIVEKNQLWFNQYWRPLSIKTPSKGMGGMIMSALSNDARLIGTYDTSNDDSACFLTDYRVRVNPNSLGIGKYPHEVWLRIVIAGDETPVFAEFLPSVPAVYGGTNELDSRKEGNSFAIDLLQHQEQINNIFSQMYMNLKQSLVCFWTANKDLLDDQQIDFLKETCESPGYYIHPQLILYSGDHMAKLGLKPKDVLSVVKADMADIVGQSLRQVNQVLLMVDQLHMLSPQEKGQPAPREISATETNQIADTTGTMYSFIGDAVDEYRAGIKKLLFEHLVCCSEEPLNVPVVSRYTEEALKKSGLDVKGDADGDGVSGTLRDIVVQGQAATLIHEYVFGSRDGVDRVSNAQNAQTLSQLIANISSIPGLAARLPASKIAEAVNEVFRMSSGFDLNMQIPPELDGPIGAAPGSPQGAAPQAPAPLSGSVAVASVADLQRRLADLESFMKAQAANAGATQPQPVAL